MKVISDSKLCMANISVVYIIVPCYDIENNVCVLHEPKNKKIMQISRDLLKIKEQQISPGSVTKNRIKKC